MKISRILVPLLFICLLFNARVFAQTAPSDVDTFASYASRVPGVVYVQFRAGYLPPLEQINMPIDRKKGDPVMRIFGEIGVTSVEPFDPVAWKDSISRRFGIDRMYVVNYAGNAAPLGVVVRLLQTGLVQSASPRYIFKSQVVDHSSNDRSLSSDHALNVPNDPGVNDQYYLQNIQAESAWDVTMGDTNVIIADVDEGVNVNHEDLKANIKFNPGETGLDANGHDKRTNGIDDDGDGYVDDWEGWNTALNNNVVAAPPCGADCEGSHGTETTGCFGAVANNNVGIAGVAPKCKILAVRISDNNGQLTGAYEGIHYASTFCAKYATHAVINNSWGGRSDAEALPFASIFPEEITARGQVCVASAGNYSLNNDITPFYPACVPGVLSVGATDRNDNPSSFTHYGHSVSVFAPGVAIYTTDLGTQNNEYTDPQVGVDGTSFSGPITAGICGLVMSAYPTLSPDAVKKKVIETCDPIKGKNAYLYHGRVNAGAALAPSTTPSLAVQDYSIGNHYLGVLGPYNQQSTVVVNFINISTAPGSNLTAMILPGPGYTWKGYDPRYQNTWTNEPLGTMPSQDSAIGSYDLIRTAQFSSGSVPVRFVINPGTPPDTLTVQISLTPEPGMDHRLLVQHATCVKQLDAVNGWAGFGYFLSYVDPELRIDSTILISQYSVRTDTGWSAPADIPGGEPIYTLDAVDNQTAWFAGATQVYSTLDGGNSWSQLPSPGIPIRSIHFSSATNGTVIGDAASGKWQIKVTRDGGQTWVSPSFIPQAGHNKQSFYNAACWVGSHGWFGTDSAQVFETSDNGSHWAPISLGGATYKQKNVMTVAFDSTATIGYAAVRDTASMNPDSAGLFYTSSSGLLWSPCPKVPYGLIPY